jgi:hypothetical protein
MCMPLPISIRSFRYSSTEHALSSSSNLLACDFMWYPVCLGQVVLWLQIETIRKVLAILLRSILWDPHIVDGNGGPGDCRKPGGRPFSGRETCWTGALHPFEHWGAARRRRTRNTNRFQYDHYHYCLCPSPPPQLIVE